MYKKTSSQTSLLEIEKYFPKILPENDWSFIFRDRIMPEINEEDFKHFYSEGIGRPNASVRNIIAILIFMGMEKLTWREAEFQYSRRLDWQIATNTEIGNAQIDHTTLYKFYERLMEEDTAIKLFVELTGKFIKECGSSVKKQRTDSFFMYGWLKLLTRYELLSETIRKFLQALRKQKVELYEKIKAELSREYLSNQLEIKEKDEEGAKKQIQMIAEDMYKILIAFENNKKIKQYDTYKILCKIFSEQCEIKEEKNELGKKVSIKEKPDTGAICSPHNTDVRCARKNNKLIMGDKAFITETCDKENKTQFITDVEVVKSTDHDSKHQIEIQDRLIENGFKPEKQYEDSAFINGKTIIESQKRGIEIEGPMSGRSLSRSEYNKDTRSLDSSDFDITVNEETQDITINKCPNGEEPVDQIRSEETGRIIVHFEVEKCKRCEIQNRCPVRFGKRINTYIVDKTDYAGAVRYHKYMTDESYQKECSIRAGVEATVSEMTRVHGVRKSRHRTRIKTKLQLIFAALACNVKRFIRHLTIYTVFEPNLA